MEASTMPWGIIGSRNYFRKIGGIVGFGYSEMQKKKKFQDLNS